MAGRRPIEKTALVWAAASAALMIVGAIGPWATALGGAASVGGLDGGRDGWFMVFAAVPALVILGAVAFGASERAVWLLPILAVIGVAVAGIDRREVLVADAASGPLSFDDIFAGREQTPDIGLEVGWGLNLAFAASFSLLLASVTFLIEAHKSRRRDAEVEPVPTE